MKNDRSVSLLFNDECIVFRLTGKNVIIDVETIIQIVELKLKNDLHKVQTELALRIDDRSTIVDRVEKQLKSRLKRIFSRMKTVRVFSDTETRIHFLTIIYFQE